MSKEEYYKKYYKVIKWVTFALILIFYPLFYTQFQDEIEGYGWCDDSHIVIGTADKEILIFDQDGKKLRPFSVVSIAGDTYDMYLQDGIYIFPNRSDYGYLFNADGKKLGREKQESYKQK